MIVHIMKNKARPPGPEVPKELSIAEALTPGVLSMLTIPRKMTGSGFRNNGSLLRAASALE